MLYLRQLSYSHLCLLGFIIAAGLTAASYYFEYVLQLQPCSLCFIQRYLVMGIGLLFLCGIRLRSLLARCIQGGAILVFSMLGVATAIRHIWLQKQPADAMVSCLPTDLTFLLQTFPLTDAVVMMIQGSDCADMDWSLLGLSMPAWVLGFFILFIVIMSYGLVCTISSNRLTRGSCPN